MRRSTASRICVVYIAIVIHSASVSGILVGVSIKLKRVLIVTTVHMTNSNLEIAEACRIHSSAGRLGGVVEIDSNVVGRAITKAEMVGNVKLEKLNYLQRNRKTMLAWDTYG